MTENEKPQSESNQLESVVIRAFRTIAIGTVSIVFAENAGKARYSTYLAANDAGYDVKFPDITVHRANEFDCRKHRTSDRVPVIGMCIKPDDLVCV